MGFEVTAKHSNGRTPVHFDDFFFLKESHRQPNIRPFLSASLGNLWNLPRTTSGVNWEIRYSSFFQAAFGNISSRENCGSWILTTADMFLSQ